MGDYQPTSRRPIADLFRKTAHGAVQRCIRLNIHPDTISYASMAAAAGAGLAFLFAAQHWVLLIVAPLFCYVRLWCNMLDGMVALASGKASRRGEILNEVPDRISDIIIFLGVAHSGLANPYLGYGGALAAVFVAYIGTFGQAVGVQREFSGVMAKPWRMVALHVGATLMLVAFPGWISAELGGLTWMDWTLIVILAGCLQTVIVRLVRIMRALEAVESET